MEMPISDRVRRLRWRLRGAWLGPAFVGLTLADTVLIRLLPLAGDGPTDWVAAFLLAAWINLIVVAVLGPLGGWWLRRRRTDLPKVVADNYAGTALLAIVTATFVALGLAHRPAVEGERDAVAAASVVARTYLQANAPQTYRRGIDRADIYRIDRDIYRVCAPGQDERRAWCVIVTTATDPPGIRRDPNRETNASLDGVTGRR